jgi:DNA-binding transcriptional ArsR family regulator
MPAAKRDSLPPRLNAMERDTLRVLFELAEGSAERTIACSLADLAEQTRTSIRTATRTIARLRERGLLTTRRRQRSAALIALSSAALPHCGTAAVSIVPAAPSNDERSRASRIGVPLPPGFIGDVNAYSIMAILLRPHQRTVAPVDLAVRYLENATAREQVRLEALKDEHGSYPIDVILTGYAQLDEGLRQHATNQRRRSDAIARERAVLSRFKAEEE